MIDTTYKIIKNKILFYNGYNCSQSKYIPYMYRVEYASIQDLHIDRYTHRYTLLYIYRMSINFNTTLYKCIKWYKIKWKSKVAH